MMVLKGKNILNRLLLISAVLILLLPACIPTATPDAPPDPNMGAFRQDMPPPQLTLDPYAEGSDQSTFCPILQLPTVFDLKIYPPPLLNEPPPRISFHDPVFGSCMARLSDRSADLQAGDPSTGLRPEGAGVQSFNADGTLILVRSTSWYWYIYSAETLQLAYTLPFNGDIEVRWDPLMADRLYFTSEHHLFHYFLKTGSQELVHDFGSDLPNKYVASVGTNHMGNASRDGRFWPLIAYGDAGQVLGLMIYDLITNEVAARLNLLPETSIRGMTMSPSGSYVLVWYNYSCPSDVSSGPAQSSRLSCGMVVYDHSLQSARQLLPEASTGDVMIDGTGSEVFVFYNLRMNSLSMVNLESGEQTDLWLIDRRQSALGMSISGRASRLPGWALVSTYGGSSNNGVELIPNQREAESWMDNSIFAIELVPSGRVARLANTFSSDLGEIHNEEWAGPQATPNDNFTRILFATNWGNPGAGQMDIYMIGLPDYWASAIP